jgi:hypothetical protein
MTNNNNSAAVNNNAEATSMKMYKVNIASQKGHDTLELTLEASIDNIIENAESKARWVFINGEKFEFQGTNYRSDTNVQRLQAQLQAMDDPAILLTGRLVGGKE